MAKSKLSFYNSIDLFIDGKQIIVYPDIEAGQSYRQFQASDLQNYLTKIISTDQEFFSDMNYGITFLWSLDGEKMVDFWKFNANYVDDRSGPLADVRIYRESKSTTDLGTASGNTLLVLGIEEKLRRKYKTIVDYLNGPAPKLPVGMQINHSFLA